MQHSSRKRLLLVLVLSLVLPGGVLAVGGGSGNPGLKTPEKSLDRFRALRLGAFIHWNPCSQTGLEISWCRGEAEKDSWFPGARVPREEYDNLYTTFNPEKFDAPKWVSLLKGAGFKYLVYVSKHHDGFCMWDTKTTAYNIMKTPFGRDVVKELSDECNKQGLAFCLYYSIADWYQPDYQPPGYQPYAGDFGGPGYELPEGQKPDMERYTKYMKTQLRELTELCGPVFTWWFDGNWSPLWTQQHGTDLYAYMRKLQPDALFCNRVGYAYNGEVYMPTWFASEDDSAGDYAVLEVGMPRFDRDIPWEYTQSSKETFSWSPGPVKDVSMWIDWVVKSACGDGNFNLGISATPLGEFEPELVDGLRRLGQWLKRYGESIYGTRGGPYIRTDWFGTTCKDNKIYLHIFKTDNGNLLLPSLPKRIINSRLLTGGTVSVEQTDSGVSVIIPDKHIQPTDTIVVLEIDGSAEKIEPIDERPVNMGTIVSASSVREDHRQYAAEMASDGDMSTYWQAKAGDKQGWLEYDLGRERTFSRAILLEGKEQGQYNRLRHCQIQAKMDGQWKTLFDIKTSSWGGDSWPLAVTDQQIRFDPVTARNVRLKILLTRDKPIIHEFKLYER